MPDACAWVLAIDCGSTTTKAILIARREGRYRLVARADAPTTVEAPFEDVTMGIRAAVHSLEESVRRRLLDGDGLLVPAGPEGGVDLVLATSSAGGGLQMMVAGVIRDLTAKSAHNAALGAGAVVTDVLAIDDGRQVGEQVDRIRSTRPDIVLLSGGVDGGNLSHVVKMSELFHLAGARPRFGGDFRLPVVFAGNRDARGRVAEVLGGTADLTIVDNLRPRIEKENVAPASRKIQEIFMEHVMTHAPNYARLAAWAGKRIMPTPAAVGRIMELIASDAGCNLLGVDVGGATTDVFSVVGGELHRTVSANLGMSYSIGNVLAEAGIQRVLRWLPFDTELESFENAIANKMVRPVTVPETWTELLAEQAVARETIRLSLKRHLALTIGLKGINQPRDINDIFDQKPTGQPLVNLMHTDVIVGSGGVLSHAPRRQQAALMLIDAIEPLGITRLFVDSIFMMPQVGLLEQFLPSAARDLLYSDCLIPLGTCIAPAGRGRSRDRYPVMTVTVHPAGEDPRQVLVAPGELVRVPLAAGQNAEVHVQPGSGLDAGAGRGVPVVAQVQGGCVGLVLDGRGRPLRFPDGDRERRRALRRWMEEVGAIDADLLPVVET